MSQETLIDSSQRNLLIAKVYIWVVFDQSSTCINHGCELIITRSPKLEYVKLSAVATILSPVPNEMNICIFNQTIKNLSIFVTSFIST